MNVNLLPWRSQYRCQQQVLFYVINLLCMMIAVIWIAMHHMVINVKLANKVKTNLYLTKILHSYDKKILQVNKVRLSLANKVGNIQFIHRLQTKNYRVANFLNKINLFFPQDVYMTYLKLEGNEMTLLASAKSHGRIAALMQAAAQQHGLINPKIIEINNNGLDSQYKINMQLQFLLGE